MKSENLALKLVRSYNSRTRLSSRSVQLVRISEFESKARLAQARRHTRIDPRSGIRTLGPVAHCRMGWQGTRTADRCCRTTPVGRARSRHRQMNFRSNCSTQALLVVTSQHRNRRFVLHCGPLKKDFNRCTNSTCGKRLCRVTAASVSRGGKAGRGGSHEPGCIAYCNFPPGAGAWPFF